MDWQRMDEIPNNLQNLNQRLIKKITTKVFMINNFKFNE